MTLIEKNRKSSVYTGVLIHVIYCYLEIIGSPTRLNTSIHRYYNYGPEYSTNTDIETLRSVIEYLRMITKSI